MIQEPARLTKILFALELRAIPNLDRRTVVKAGIVAGAALCVPAGLLARSRAAGVFIVDRRFAPSAATAMDGHRQGAMVIDPREEDLGLAWRTRIPAWLTRNSGVVEGVTLWSDFVISETFGRDLGLALVGGTQSVSFAQADGLSHWRLA